MHNANGYTPAFLEGGGTMGGLMRAKDWSTTAVGSPQSWPSSLCSAISLLLHSRFPMFVWWGEELTMFYNDAYIPIAGNKHPIALGAKGHEIWAEVWQAIGPVVETVKRTKEASWAEDQLLYVNRKGYIEEAYFTFSHSPIITESGEVGGIFCVVTETTGNVIAARKLAQNETELNRRVQEGSTYLQEQKQFTESIIQASLDGIYALKAVRNAHGAIIDFVYRFANNELARLLNLTVDEVVGSSMLTLIPENRTNGFFELFCNVLASGRLVHSETHFVTTKINGWFDFTIVPIDSETVVATIRDVTERKETANQVEEQRNLLDNILKNSSNGISVSKVFRDENGVVVDAQTILANDSAVKFIGLPKEEYLNKRATEIEPAVMGSPYYQACINTLNTGDPFMMQYQMQSTGRWLELTVSKLDNDHLIQVFTDVTPIKEVQLQLERYVEELKRSNQNLEEFAYAASHDLKEPMRKIQIFSDRLRTNLQSKLGEDDQRFFDRIENAAQRMSSLIDDLLMYSHISKGAVLDDIVDLNKKVRLVLEDLELEIEEKKANVTVGDLPIVRGNRRQLQQLFQNLAGNALKYSKPGLQPQIKITSTVTTGADSKLQLAGAEGEKLFYQVEVKDNGIGFDAEDAERIFNVFTRLHGNAEYKGTGVGLSIAKKVVENHGGYIWAESTPGEGSTFKFLLPVDNSQ